MSRPRIRWSEPLPRRVWVYLGLCGLGLALLTTLAINQWVSLRQTPDFRSSLLTTDFPPFLTGARLIAAGQGAQLYDPVAQSAVQAAILAPYGAMRATLPYDHLPFLALALAPVAGLPLPVSYALWLGATGLALLGALGLLAAEMRAVARDAIERRWAPRALVALSLGFFPVYQDLLLAQTAPWDLLAYTLAIRYLRQERAVAAGLALTLALVKPQLLIVPLGVLLLTRQWRTLVAFSGLSGALLLLVTPLLGGPGWLVDYGRLLADVATVRADNSLIHPALMENLRGAFLLFAGETAAWALPATALVSLAVLAWVGRAWWGAAHTWAADPAGWDARWAAALLATLLVNPHGLAYELTLWPLVAVLAWRAVRADPAPGAVPRLAPWLGAGYLAGTLTLPLIALIPGWPLHLGVVFMLAALGRLGRRSAGGGRRAAVAGRQLSVSSPQSSPIQNSEIRTPNSRALQGVALGIMLGAALMLGWLNGPWLAGWLREADVPPAQAAYPFTDYAAFVNAARLLTGGQGAALYRLEAQRAPQRREWGTRYDEALAVPFVNPPWFAGLLWPLAGLPLGRGFLLWAAACAAMTVAATAVLVAWARPPPLVGAAFMLAPLGFLPFWRTLLLGQTSALVLLGLALATVALARGADRRGGIALALVSVKPHLLILPLLALARTGRWRALVTLVGAGAVLLLLPLPLTGFSVLSDYVKLLQSPAYAGYENLPQVQTWRALIESTLGLSGPLAGALLLAGPLAALALGAWAWQPPVASRRSPVASRRSSVASRQSPVASRQSSVAGRQSAVASRRSSVAGRRSSVAGANVEPLTQHSTLNTQHSTLNTRLHSAFRIPHSAFAAWELRWALTLLLTPWFTPHIHVHDLLIALVPGAAILRYLYQPAVVATMSRARRAAGFACLWGGWIGLWPLWLLPDTRLALWGSGLMLGWIVVELRGTAQAAQREQAWTAVAHPQ